MVEFGGQHGYGDLYQFDPNGTGDPLFLHSFTGKNGDGANPSGSPIQDENGNLYGVTEFGGPNADGVIYTYTADGRYVALYDFLPDNFGFNKSSPTAFFRKALSWNMPPTPSPEPCPTA